MKRNGTLSRDSHDYQGQLPRIEEEASGFSMIIFFNGRPKHKAKAPVINYAPIYLNKFLKMFQSLNIIATIKIITIEMTTHPLVLQCFVLSVA